MNNNEIWQAVLSELELSISKANFITWFKNTGIVFNKEGSVVLCVPNTFARAWLEKKYHTIIIKSLERITDKPIRKLEYKIDNIKNIVAQGVTEEQEILQPQEFKIDSGFQPNRQPTVQGGFAINPKYTFETFVVGKGSELAYAASQAVVNKIGEVYNPLFVYGGVGLGKTHLIQAVGNALLKKNPATTIMYVSAEKFSNDFIQSIKEGSAKEFQNQYRHIDLLLIDDIQFIAGKTGTQESFFHTFNELHQQNKQIILTSDRPPKAIPALEDRLKSRFEWGMIADISLPDFETRVAILEKKCQEKNFILEDKILEEIAKTFESNIRELEGFLNKTIAYHQIKNINPSLESVKSLLSGVEISPAKRQPTARNIMEAVGSFYNVPAELMVGKGREKKIAMPRQIIMYLLREELSMSYPTIGHEVGGRDHTTAMHAHEKVRKEVERNGRVKQDIEMIRQKIQSDNM
jgi:chromosomal replication initiator protein